MSATAAERMDPARRERLVRAAAREFARSGFAAASLNAVIRECGMSKSSFYHFVPSKQELFALVVRELGGRLLAALHVPAPSALVGEAFWPEVEAVLRRLGEASTIDPDYAALGRMFYASDAEGAAADAVEDAFAAARRWVDAVIETGRASGALRTELPASLQKRLTFAVLRALDETALAESDEAPDETQLVLALAALRRLLAPDAA